MSKITSSPTPLPATPELSWAHDYNTIPDYNLPLPLEPTGFNRFEQHYQFFEHSELTYHNYLQSLFPDIQLPKYNVSSFYTRQFKVFHPYNRQEIYNYLSDKVSFMGSTSEVQGIYFDFVEIYPHQSISQIRKIISEGPYPDIELLYVVVPFFSVKQL